MHLTCSEISVPSWVSVTELVLVLDPVGLWRHRGHTTLLIWINASTTATLSKLMHIFEHQSHKAKCN